MTAWYAYPRIDDFGAADTFGGLKMDSNFAVPSGQAITALHSGIVSGINAPDGHVPAYGHVITIKLDTPINSVFTHDAYLHLKSTTKSVGTHVAVGDIVGISGGDNPGAGLQKASVGYAGYADSHYAFGPTWNQNQGNPALNPVPVLDKLGHSGQQTSGGVPLTLGHFCQELALNLAGNFTYTPTKNIIAFLISWAHWEGGGTTNACKWNILNTMQDESGATQCPNTLPGIKSYPDPATGLKAQQDALQNGRYKHIVQAITANDERALGFLADQSTGFAHRMSNAIAQEMSVWLNGRASPLAEDYCLRIMQGAGINHPSVEGGTKSGGAATGPGKWGEALLGGNSGDIQPPGNPVNPNDIGAAFAGVNTFFSNLNTFFSNPTRLAKIGLGVALVIVGLVLAVKEFTPALGKLVH